MKNSYWHQNKYWWYAENQGNLFAFPSESERDYWVSKLGLTALTKFSVRHRYLPSDVRAAWKGWPNEASEDEPDLSMHYMKELKRLNLQHSQLKRDRIRLQRMLKNRGHEVSLRAL